jgi:hypothetical protein
LRLRKEVEHKSGHDDVEANVTAGQAVNSCDDEGGGALLDRVAGEGDEVGRRVTTDEAARPKAGTNGFRQGTGAAADIEPVQAGR